MENYRANNKVKEEALASKKKMMKAGNDTDDAWRKEHANLPAKSLDVALDVEGVDEGALLRYLEEVNIGDAEKRISPEAAFAEKLDSLDADSPSSTRSTLSSSGSNSSSSSDGETSASVN